MSSLPAVSPNEPRPGWLDFNPNGFLRLTHAVSLPMFGACTDAELAVLVFLMVCTEGLGKKENYVALDFMETIFRDRKKRRTLQDGLAGLRNRGFIVATGEPGEITCFRVVWEAIINSAPIAELETEKKQGAKAEPESKTRTVPALVEIRTKDGKVLPRHHSGPLTLAAEPGRATVSRCGACKLVAINEMVPACDLDWEGGCENPHPRKEKAKVQPIRAEKPPSSVSPGVPQPAVSAPLLSPPAKSKTPKPKADRHQLADEKAKALHKYLCSNWKDRAFQKKAPTARQVNIIAEALGEAPVSKLHEVMMRRSIYLRGEAEHYGVVRKMAVDALVEWEAEVGVLCGCEKQTRLLPGDVCSNCGPHPEAPPSQERPPQETWDLVKRQLADRLEHLPYENFFLPTWLVKADGRKLQVAVPGSLTRDHISEVYPLTVIKAVEDALGPGFEVEWLLEEGVELAG